MQLLVAKNLLGHSDLDVKVFVASCVSEILRITAPNAPYDDNQMKVILQVFVESFGKLDDISSPSFLKSVFILKAVAQLHLCLVMLDLECDALILDMFRFFLKTIRPNYSEIVFSCMESIMSCVLERSEDISIELISCLLNSVKKDNKEIQSFGRRLGEKIICNFAAKLELCLGQGSCEYRNIITSICQDKELKDSLKEAGHRLFSPPSDTEELLILLDRTEKVLWKVDQSASPSILGALRPAREVLVAENLLGHSNLEVKVAVASCIGEILRVTALDYPYGDDQMKVILQVIVESFEKLDDISSRSFPKRVLLLEHMAVFHLYLVMLDLECDALILDMFRIFLKTIRLDHSETVFSYMESIMSLVLEESEDISIELISCLLNSVKKNNKEVLPCAYRLARRVIRNSAAKLKVNLVKVQSLPDSCEYGKIVDKWQHVSGKFSCAYSKIFDKWQYVSGKF